MQRNYEDGHLSILVSMYSELDQPPVDNVLCLFRRRIYLDLHCSLCCRLEVRPPVSPADVVSCIVRYAQKGGDQSLDRFDRRYCASDNHEYCKVTQEFIRIRGTNIPNHIASQHPTCNSSRQSINSSQKKDLKETFTPLSRSYK